jgi:hypothetical protein
VLGDSMSAFMRQLDIIHGGLSGQECVCSPWAPNCG